MKYKINPKYESLAPEIRRIPQGDYTAARVFRNERNTVELVEAQGEQLVVKRYKRPSWVNRVAYSFLRRSKAHRAYDNAFLLRSKGIDTAEPIAYIERRKYGLMHTAWYISRYLPLPDAQQTLDSLPAKEQKREFGRALMRFVHDLFGKDIIYKDCNPGNFLISRDGDEWHFALVDINRLYTGKPSLYRQMKAMVQFGLGPVEAPFVLQYYHEISGYNLDDMAYYFFLCRRQDRKKQDTKRRIREYREAKRLRKLEVRS